MAATIKYTAQDVTMDSMAFEVMHKKITLATEEKWVWGGQDWKHEVPEVKRQLTADKAKNDLEQVNASVPVFSSLK